MTHPAIALALFPVAHKKRVLLVNSFSFQRDLRARILRQLGVEVDCAADITEARSLWRADAYSLVLVDVRDDASSVQEFCAEIRRAKPAQAVAFLVGKPHYLAQSPDAELGAAGALHDGHGDWNSMVAALYADACEALPRRYGFQEASWRIAAVRNLKDPRPERPATENRFDRLWTAVTSASATPA